MRGFFRFTAFRVRMTSEGQKQINFGNDKKNDEQNQSMGRRCSASWAKNEAAMGMMASLKS
jgi:hypothetical protein